MLSARDQARVNQPFMSGLLCRMSFVPGSAVGSYGLSKKYAPRVSKTRCEIRYNKICTIFICEMQYFLKNAFVPRRSWDTALAITRPPFAQLFLLHLVLHVISRHILHYSLRILLQTFLHILLYILLHVVLDMIVINFIHVCTYLRPDCPPACLPHHHLPLDNEPLSAGGWVDVHFNDYPTRRSRLRCFLYLHFA